MSDSPNQLPPFVAINYVDCQSDFVPKFKQLFQTRAGAIDRMPGFRSIEILEPKEGHEYLIITRWDDEASFKHWLKSDAFREGHKRAFALVAKAKANNEPPLMKARFMEYRVMPS